MSGHSYSVTCPKCNEIMSAYEDHKPHPNVYGQYIYCGFEYYTATNTLSLEDVNELRAEENEIRGYSEDSEDYLKPLKELPKHEE